MAMTKDEKLQKMLDDLKKTLPELNSVEIHLPSTEERNEAILEAQSVINWYETGGKGFRDKHCKWCGQLFMYAWDVPCVAFCSIRCITASLAEIGIKWTVGKPASERWGKTRPAIIGPEATALLKEMSSA